MDVEKKYKSKRKGKIKKYEKIFKTNNIPLLDNFLFF